jgi:hypothetical protein
MNQKQSFGILSKNVATHLALSSLMLGFATLSFGSSAAHADETSAPDFSSCSVPVCDIPAEVEKFRQMGQGKRFDTMNALSATYRESRNAADLKNIAELASRLEAMLTEVKDEAWVIQTARNLRSTMLIQLARYSELNAAVLAGYYEQIPGESSRNGLLDFWYDRIKEAEDKATLMELMDLFSRVSIISAHTPNDPPYLSAKARQNESVITSRITQLYPYFEGSYRISVNCDKDSVGGSLGSYCGGNFMNRLVIMDTMSGDHLQIVMANKESGTQIYNFNQVIISGGGSTFEAIGTPSGVPSQLHLVLDKTSGHISGTIRNADAIGSVEISGDLDMTPATIYDFAAKIPNKDPLTAEMLTRTYAGQYSGRNVKLTLASFGPDQMGATMSFDDLPNYRLRFQLSRFYPKLGILVLLGGQPNGSHLKLTMFFKNTGTGFEVIGLGFTDLNGATQELSLTSTFAK